MGRKPAQTSRAPCGITLDPEIINALDRIAKEVQMPRNIVIEEAVVRAFSVPDIAPFSDALRDRGAKVAGPAA